VFTCSLDNILYLELEIDEFATKLSKIADLLAKLGELIPDEENDD
jgi:hypothetical protein